LNLREDRVNTYIVSVALGLLVGAIYGLFNVRSPAPTSDTDAIVRARDTRA
jgi:xanthosine utilization system XapX-like protein